MVLGGRVHPLTQWLTSLDEEALATVLTRRPDVLNEPRPRDLRELAGRLDDPYSVVAVLRESPITVLQVAEAIQGLGGRCHQDTLIDYLAPADDAASHAQDATDVLALLAERALVWPRPNGTLVATAGLAACYPNPVGLGPPLQRLLTAAAAETVNSILRTLERPRPKTKAQCLQDLGDYLRAPGVVSDIVATAPPAVAIELRRLADPPKNGVIFSSDDYIERMAAAQWGLERGLLFGSTWTYQQMPAEVARALRGPDDRAPFTPRPDPPVTTQVNPVDVDRESAAQASAFADHAIAVLDLVSQQGLTMLKSGGVGTRELNRLTKATGAEAAVVRLVLELAGQAALITGDSLRAGHSEDFHTWRDREPAERFAELVSAWWFAGFIPTQTRDQDDKVVPVLLDGPSCDGCRAARVAVMTALAALPPGTATTRQTLVSCALWARPVVHLLDQDGDQPFATTWREAELLGLVAHGCLTAMGRAVVAEDEAALAALATQALPGTTHQAVFGADLTVVVLGAPAAGVSRLLDRVADREGRGGAAVWRLTPVSLRRALDEGTTGEALALALAKIAIGSLPQPLQYLIADVARRHGTLRVQDVASCVRSDDTPLLAQVAADRALRSLGLRQVAPTVLFSSVNAATTVKALRAAGYLPLTEDANGAVVLTAGPASPRTTEESAGGYLLTTLGRDPSRAVSWGPAAVDPQVLAADLRRAGVRGPRAGDQPG